jgi:DNA polymerase III subunit delta
MSITYVSELKRLKTEGKPNPIYHLTAKIPYLERQIIDEIANLSGGKSTSLRKVNLEEIGTSQLEELVCSGGLLSGNIVILITGAGKIKGDRAKATVSVFKNMIEGNVAIFTESEIAKNTIIGKFLSTNAKQISEGGVNERMLLSWIKKRFSDDKCSISSDAAHLLIEHTLGEMSILSMEINKLISFAGEGVMIQSSHIKEIIPKKSDLIIFQVLDALADKKTADGIRLIHTLIHNGEPPERALSMVVNHFIKVLLAGELTKQKLGQKEIAGRLKCHPFVAKKSIASSRRFKRNELLKYLEELQKADVAFKTGKAEPLFALESALFQLV